jgi:hypothetical protein
MAWLAVDKDGTECLFKYLPSRGSISEEWFASIDTIQSNIVLVHGSIKALIGKDLTWKDEPVEI